MNEAETRKKLIDPMPCGAGASAAREAERIGRATALDSATRGRRMCP
jgi:hypothetical protein